jgi:hypothetical protein
MKKKSNVIKSLLGGFVLCGLFVSINTVLASDHDEAPLVKMNAGLDLTDLYVFDTAGDTVTAVICFAGFNDSRPQPDTEALYDPELMYALNIDNNQDNIADTTIYWRYGQNADGEWGVEVTNVPGSTFVVIGAVETVIDDVEGAARIWTGHADDPFFFDAEGYLNTVATGDLDFDSSRDFLAGLNVTALVIEMSISDISPATDNELRFWATSSTL